MTISSYILLNSTFKIISLYFLILCCITFTVYIPSLTIVIKRFSATLNTQPTVAQIFALSRGPSVSIPEKG